MLGRGTEAWRSPAIPREVKGAVDQLGTGQGTGGRGALGAVLRKLGSIPWQSDF